VGRASSNGSDDKTLLASLRTDGQPAILTGQPATMIAQGGSRPSPARTAIGLRTYETTEDEEAPASAAAPAPAVQAQAAGQAVGQVAVGIPLPPERPFDLGTIPNAASPVRAAPAPVALQPSRPAAGSLSAAPLPSGGFQQVSSFAAQDPTKYVGRSVQN
jgi:rare lipoprotein A